MGRVLGRVITSVVMTVLLAVPVAGLLCVRECAPAERIEASTHCHDEGSTDVAGIRAVAPDSCVPFALTDVAPRERGVPSSALSASTAALIVRAVLHTPAVVHAGHRVAHAALAGLPRGAPLPLRI